MKDSSSRDYGNGTIGYTDSGTGGGVLSNSGVTAKTTLPVAGKTSPEEHAANRRPNTGDPNSEWEAPNGDKRYYDDDGKPIYDYDHDDHNDPDNHPHDQNGGHWHKWENGKRSKNPTISPLGGLGMVLGGGILLGVICADDLTYIGVADNVYADQIIAWIDQGWQALLG